TRGHRYFAPYDARFGVGIAHDGRLLSSTLRPRPVARHRTSPLADLGPWTPVSALADRGRLPDVDDRSQHWLRARHDRVGRHGGNQRDAAARNVALCDWFLPRRR